MRYQQGYLDGQKKRKGARGNALRQRPKSSLLFDNHRDSQAAMKGNQRRSKQPHSRQKGTSYHKGVQNHSIENLQRQVLENQKILLAQAQKSHKASKRVQNRHNHNNSISHPMPSHLLIDDSKYNTVNNTQHQLFQPRGQAGVGAAPLTSTSIKKRGANKKKDQANRQYSRLLGQNAINSTQLASGMIQHPSQKQNLSLKMTQQHLAQGFKHFNSMMGGGGGISTTASTSGANAQTFQSGKSLKLRKQLHSHKRKASYNT